MIYDIWYSNRAHKSVFEYVFEYQHSAVRTEQFGRTLKTLVCDCIQLCHEFNADSNTTSFRTAQHKWFFILFSFACLSVYLSRSSLGCSNICRDNKMHKALSVARSLLRCTAKERSNENYFSFNLKYLKQWLINFSFFFKYSFILQTAKWLPFDTKCIIVNM